MSRVTPQRTPLLPPPVATTPNPKPTPPLPFHHQPLEPTRKRKEKHKAHEPPRTCPPAPPARAHLTPPPAPSFFKTQITSPPATPRHLSLRRSYCLCRHNKRWSFIFFCSISLSVSVRKGVGLLTMGLGHVCLFLAGWLGGGGVLLQVMVLCFWLVGGGL